jgi:hypothetical protein
MNHTRMIAPSDPVVSPGVQHHAPTSLACRPADSIAAAQAGQGPLAGSSSRELQRLSLSLANAPNGMTTRMTATLTDWPPTDGVACAAGWGWQASNLRPGGYEPPALTD